MSAHCSMCSGPMVSTGVYAPNAIFEGRTVPAVIPVVVSACPTCDRARCPNAGCGMPTGSLLPFGGRGVEPLVCDHCNLPITYKGPRP